MALAIVNNCLCPADKLLAPSDKIVCSFKGNLLTNLWQFAAVNAFNISSLVAFSLPYLTLFSIVSSNKTASCKTIEIQSLKSFLDISLILIPSILIEPESIS